MDQYWYDYYNNPSLTSNCNHQVNIGRTRNGRPVSNETWQRTLTYIKDLLNIHEGYSDLLELCCGNGQIIGNLAQNCGSSLGVDYSKPLLDQLKIAFPNIQSICANILDIHFPVEKFDAIILYFSIQHFDERESLVLIDRTISWLKPKGKILIGDIPNELKKWEYLKDPEHQKDYMERLINKQPKIGNWFNPGYFLAMSSYIPGVSVRYIEQPPYQINSSYRFDVVIEKN